jgi:hypothetical protein
MYVFDVHGTLVGNESVSDEDARKMLMVLRAAGHRLVLMTGDPTRIPHQLRALADDVWEKPITFRGRFNKDTVVFDDCTQILRCAARAGAKVVAAQQMGDWIARQDWANGS